MYMSRKKAVLQETKKRHKASKVRGSVLLHLHSGQINMKKWLAFLNNDQMEDLILGALPGNYLG